MLIHEMSSGQEFLKVVVADVNGDRHPDGRPKVKGVVRALRNCPERNNAECNNPERM